MAEARPVVLAAGGTGGHVFPAEALAGELEARGVPFALVTDARGRQWQGALSRRPIHYIHSASPTGSLQRRLAALPSLGLGLLDAWRALGRIGPAAVVGFGGYASVPTMIAARLRGTPAMVHEQNAVLGKANRLVLGGVSKVATSFARTRFVDDGRARLVGNPVREPVRALRASVYRAPGRDRVIDLLIFGGSQGAASFSQVIPEAILSLAAPMRARLRIVQQCRPEDLDRVTEAYRQAKANVELQPFFTDLPERMANAHLVICRAGASTIAELTVLGRPAILVPLPGALDADQKNNAMSMEAVKAGWIAEQATLSPPSLANRLTSLFGDPRTLQAAAAAAKALGQPRAVEQLADLVEATSRGKTT